MNRPVSVLGVVSDSYVVSGEAGTRWLRRRTVDRTVEFRDWTVDGRPLRELLAYKDGSIPAEVTPLGNEQLAGGVGAATIRCLLGLPADDGFLVAMPDGRAALLFCPMCFDLDCATVTAEIVLTDEIAEWREIAWQVGYEPLDLADSEFASPTIRFERTQYDAELNRLLVLESG